MSSSISQLDRKLPDMTGWSEYRKANYFKTQLLIAKRYNKNATLPTYMQKEGNKYINK